jgi:hypothetical protein
MSVVERLMKLEQVHQLIKMKATGSPDEFAIKIGKSRKTVYNLMDELEANTTYNKQKMSFEYANEFELKLEVNGEKTVGGENIYTDVKILHRAY